MRDTREELLEAQLSAARGKVAELTGQRDSLAKQLKAHQEAWDCNDLHKRLSSLVFEQAHGVAFEQAFVGVAKQRDELLGALEGILYHFVPNRGNLKVEDDMIKQAHAAIAKVKGGA